MSWVGALLVVTGDWRSIAGWTVAAVLLHGAVLAALWRIPQPPSHAGRALQVFEMVTLSPPVAKPQSRAVLPPAPAPVSPPPPLPAAAEPDTPPPAVAAQVFHPVAPPPKPRSPATEPTPPARPAAPSRRPATPSPRPSPPQSAASAFEAPPVRPQPAVSLPSPPAPAPIFVAADASPAYLRNPPPPYPLAARRRGLEGVVLLMVAVDAGGKPGDISVLRSSGHGMLDNSAVSAVKGWRFAPATEAGRPVASTVEVPVRFRLGD